MYFLHSIPVVVFQLSRAEVDIHIRWQQMGWCSTEGMRWGAASPHTKEGRGEGGSAEEGTCLHQIIATPSLRNNKYIINGWYHEWLGWKTKEELGVWVTGEEGGAMSVSDSGWRRSYVCEWQRRKEELCTCNEALTTVYSLYQTDVLELR